MYLAKVIHADGFSRLVGIKLLHRKWSENKEIGQRMRDEARLLGWLRHRNIVDVIDLTSIDGRAAVIMEYLDAVDFKSVVQSLAERGERVPPYAALESIAFVASALDAAYNRPPYEGEKPLRVIHRDIKPSNIMVDEAGTVKVLDFGVARGEFENRESHTSELQFGSVEYMPPERLFFEPETDRADVYSLGATLFEVLTGERLGKAKGRAEKHAAFLEDRLSFLAASCPLANPQGGDMARLIREMCSYNADNRPSAESVVLRARTLARLMPGPALTEWSEVVVKPLVAEARRAPREPNPLTDSIMSEDSTVFGAVEVEKHLAAARADAPLDEPATLGDVPREDQRWAMLRQAALAELETHPAATGEEDFGDEPTRIGLDLSSIVNMAATPHGAMSAPMPKAAPAPKPAKPPAPTPAPAPAPKPAPSVTVAPPPAADLSASMPKALARSSAPPPPKPVKSTSLAPGALSAPMPRGIGAASPAVPLVVPPAAPMPFLPEIMPGDLDPPSAEALKPILAAGHTMVRDADAAESADEAVVAGLERLRANMTMVPPDDFDEAPTTSTPPRSQPRRSSDTFPIMSGPRPMVAAPPPAKSAAPARSTVPPKAPPPKPTRAPARPPPDPFEGPPPSGTGAMMLVAAVVGMGVLLGLLLGGGYVGWLYYQSTSAATGTVAVATPASAVTPAAIAPVAPAAAAAAGPNDVVFASVAADTRSVSVECGAVSATGATEAVVVGPVTGPCLVSLVKKDRSRLRADVAEPTAGRWTCFSADAKSCTK